VLASTPARLHAERDVEGAVTTRIEAADGNPIGTLGLACAAALVAAVDSSGLSRFGICAGPPCTCVFVDRTRNHRRRFCSDRCNDRMAQVAHRRRVAAR
jgi:predicted RNA-binding Zn ribbon-like protein